MLELFLYLTLLDPNTYLHALPADDTNKSLLCQVQAYPTKRVYGTLVVLYSCYEVVPRILDNLGSFVILEELDPINLCQWRGIHFVGFNIGLKQMELSWSTSKWLYAANKCLEFVTADKVGEMLLLLPCFKEVSAKSEVCGLLPTESKNGLKR